MKPGSRAAAPKFASSVHELCTILAQVENSGDSARPRGLATFLAQHTPDILDQWQQASRRLLPTDDLSTLALRDHIPELLARLREQAEAAAAGDVPAAPHDESAEHAEQRLDLGYDLGEVVLEYGILRDVVLRRALAADALTLADICLFNHALDDAIASAVSHFARIREQRHRSLEKVGILQPEGSHLQQSLISVVDATREAVVAAPGEQPRWQDILETAPALFARLRGDDHALAFANRAFRAFFGPAARLGEPLFARLPQLCAALRPMADAALTSGEPVAHNETAVGEHFFDVVCHPVRTPSGSVDGVLVQVNDVSERVGDRQRLESVLRDSQEHHLLLQQRADFEQQLIGIVSHDLRTPLSAILLSASSALHRGGPEDRAHGALTRIVAAAERAVRMIHDLLDFTRSRLGTGIPITVAPVDLTALAAQVVDEVRQSHAGRRVALHSPGPVHGDWDADRLAQVLANLLVNALDYSGDVEAPIAVHLHGAGDADVVLAVHNHGQPIDPELMPKLFEPLRRDKHSRGSQGRSIGLGLFIVQQIVAAHGGTIGVTSTHDAGTTFTVRLPRHRP